MVKRDGSDRRLSSAVSLDGGPIRVEPRQAWLLQVNRLAHFPELTPGDFVNELLGVGYPASERQLAQWESGNMPVEVAAASAFDTLLGSDAPTLTAAIAFLETTPIRVVPRKKATPPEPLDQADFDLALERLLAGDGSGLDWYRVLSDARARSISYFTAGTWASLTRMLFSELSRAVGPAQALRKGAVSSLVSQGEEFTFRAFSSFVREASCHALAYAALCLVYGQGRDYNDLAIESLGHQDPGASWGAMHSVAAKLALGHFRRRDIPRIESQLLASIDRTPVHDASEALFRALPEDSQLRIAEASENGAKLLELLRWHDPLGERRLELAGAITSHAREALKVTALGDDPLLGALVNEALLHPHFEGRDAARITLFASPYRSALARGALELVHDLPPEHHGALGEFLVFMADGTHLDDLIALARPETPVLLRHYAFLAMARIPGPLPVAAMNAIHAALQKPTTLAIRGAVFALAMHGKFEDEWGSIVLVDDPLVNDCWTHQGTAIFE